MVILPLFQLYYQTIVEWVAKAVDFFLQNPTKSIPTKNISFLCHRMSQDVTGKKEIFDVLKF